MEPIRLLMLEDNPRDAELIDRLLRRSDLTFQATVVDDEVRFRSSLESSDPDIILSDYHLPSFDGVTALRIARILAPSTPFIFVSGSIGEERAVEALREGATDYVLKDRLPRLPAAILRALAERRERQLRHDAEVALRASEQRFQYAASATREIIWDWNLSTSRIWFSDALRDHWGYGREEKDFDTRWFEERIHLDDRVGAMASLHEALARKDRWSAEFRFARADQSFSHVLAHGMVVSDGHGEPTRIIGAILDITERLQLEHQLEQLRRIESLGRVAATVAHEFNNVLMGLSPVAERMARLPVTEDANVRMSALITHSVSRGRRLTEEILTFSKPAEPEVSAVALDIWLHDFTPELRALAGNCVDLRVRTPASSLIVSMDPVQMQQVVSNLVLNARHAMPDGGGITIALGTDGEHVTLSVADSGMGMPPEVVDRIFEPLFTTKRCGTGLGLAVAQQIVARHHGTIQVSSAVGQGTTFEITLPLVRAEGAWQTGTET
jgi:PAS domain S-box-containing protein